MKSRKNNSNKRKILYLSVPIICIVSCFGIGFGTWVYKDKNLSSVAKLNANVGRLTSKNFITLTSIESNMLEYNEKYFKDIDNKNPIDNNHPGFVRYTFNIVNSQPNNGRIYFNFKLKIKGIKTSMSDYVPNSFMLPTQGYWWVISEGKVTFSDVKENSQTISNNTMGDVKNATSTQSSTVFQMEFRFKDFSSNRNFNQRLIFELTLDILN